MNETSLLNYNYLWVWVHHTKGPLWVPPLSSLLDGEKLCHLSVDFFVAQRLGCFPYEVLLPVLIRKMRPLFTWLDSAADEVLCALNPMDVNASKKI